MTKYRGQSPVEKKVSQEKEKVPKRKAEAGSSESCRCKEVAKKTPREMLGLMIDDLTFWKKQKGNNPGKSD
jgi:hypothetical protein